MNNIMYLPRWLSAAFPASDYLLITLLIALALTFTARANNQRFLDQVAELIRANKNVSERPEQLSDQYEADAESDTNETTEQDESNTESHADESDQETGDPIPEVPLETEEEQMPTPEATETAEPAEPLATDSEIFEAIVTLYTQILNTLTTQDAEGNQLPHLKVVEKRLERLSEEHNQLVKQLDAAPLALYGRLGRVEQLANESIEQSAKFESQLDAILQKLTQTTDAAKPYDGETFAVQENMAYIQDEPVHAASANNLAEPVLAPAQNSTDARPQYQAYNPADQTGYGFAPPAAQFQAYQPNLENVELVPATVAKDEPTTEADMPNFDDEPAQHNLDDLIIGGLELPLANKQRNKRNNLGWLSSPHRIEQVLQSQAAALSERSSTPSFDVYSRGGKYYMTSTKVLRYEESSEVMTSPDTSHVASIGVANVVHLKPYAAPLAVFPGLIVKAGNGDEPSGKPEEDKDDQPPAKVPAGNANMQAPIEKPEETESGGDDLPPTGDPAPPSSGSSSSLAAQPRIHEFPLVLDANKTYMIGQYHPSRWSGEAGDLIRSHETDGHKIYRIVDVKAFNNHFRVRVGKAQVGGVGFIVDPQVLSRIVLSTLSRTSLANSLQSDWIIERTAGGSFNDIYFLRNNSCRTRLVLRLGVDSLDWQPADILQFLSCIKLTNVIARKGVAVARTIGHSRMPGIPSPPIDFTIETALTGIPVYEWWNVSRDTLYARRAVLTELARQVAQIHKAKMYAYAIGRLDHSIADNHEPADGWPVKPQIIYFRGGRENQHIGLGMIKGNNRKAREDAHMWDNSFEWREDCFMRWFDLIGRPALRSRPLDTLKENMRMYVALTYLMIYRIGDRRNADIKDGKEKFHLAHVDLGYQNILAEPVAFAANGQARIIKEPHGGSRGGSAGDAFVAKLSIIDWDDAKFLPMDRGYLAYPPWLYKWHYLPWWPKDVPHKNNAFNSEAMYEAHRRDYVDHLKSQLGDDAHLVDRWTKGSHWAAALDDALEKALCAGTSPHRDEEKWAQAPYLIGHLIWTKLQSGANEVSDDLIACSGELVGIGRMIEEGRDGDDAMNHFVNQFNPLLDLLLEEGLATETWVFEPYTVEMVAAPTEEPQDGVHQPRDAVEEPMGDAPAELEDTAVKPEAVAEQSKAVVVEPKDPVELPGDTAQVQPKDADDDLAELIDETGVDDESEDAEEVEKPEGQDVEEESG